MHQAIAKSILFDARFEQVDPKGCGGHSRFHHDAFLAHKWLPAIRAA
jgi:hypothetical protein